MRTSKAKRQEILNELRANATGERDKDGGKVRLVLYFIDGDSGKTEQCPFCGKNHIHGLGEGHRGAHCAFDYVTGRPFEQFDVIFKNSDGQVFNSYDGYILKRKADKS